MYFRASTAANKAYTQPILSRYTPGISSSSRRLPSNIMSRFEFNSKFKIQHAFRSYTPSYASPTPRVTIATTYTNYSNYRLNRYALKYRVQRAIFNCLETMRIKQATELDGKLLNIHLPFMRGGQEKVTNCFQILINFRF
jgi:hypothetical protein